MTDEQPQVKDVVIFEDQEYVIRAIVAEEDRIVLTRLGDATGKPFVLKARHLRWWPDRRAWRPVGVDDFFEARE